MLLKKKLRVAQEGRPRHWETSSWVRRTPLGAAEIWTDWRSNQGTSWMQRSTSWEGRTNMAMEWQTAKKNRTNKQTNQPTRVYQWSSSMKQNHALFCNRQTTNKFQGRLSVFELHSVLWHAYLLPHQPPRLLWNGTMVALQVQKCFCRCTVYVKIKAYRHISYVFLQIQ